MFLNKIGKMMDKNNRLDYFEKLTSALTTYSNDEIETGIIAYFFSKLGGFNKEEALKLLIGNTQKYSNEAKNVFFEYEFPIDIEMLIEFFEYLIEKNDRTENGIVFTPKYISDYISKELFANVKSWDKNTKIIDPGCGCGIFLISAIDEVHKKFGIEIKEIIENNIYGIDLLDDNIRRCRYVLQIYCLMNGVYLETLSDNLISADSLDSDWGALFNLSDKFDYIIGNPPYVNTHDMSKTTISFLKKSFITTKTGVFNIFYAFIEYGLKQLSPNGFLEFIVPNNFLTIKSAEALRTLLQKKKSICSIIDFADNMVFRPVRTYNCIIKLSNLPQNEFKYSVMKKTDNIAKELTGVSFNRLKIDALNKNGWILVNEKTLENINRIEGQKYPIKDYIRTGIATLRDGVYFVEKSSEEFFKNINGIHFPIEAEIVKPIYKIPKLKNCVSVKDAMQYIIFPYIKGVKGYELIAEDVFSEKYPNAYTYLREMRSILDERDNGKGNAVAWYAYGRTQGLNKYGKKLMFSTFANHPKFIYIDDENALFCNGYAVFENKQFPLSVLEKILNSSIMDYYVSHTSYSIKGGYYCYQKKYIERFSIPELSSDELNWIAYSPQNEVNLWLQKKYDLAL